jgi:pimeloyl-ACP methyl ester carboxylesterase
MKLSFYEANPERKRTIVFVHGGGLGPWMWKKQFEYFSQFRILAPELPGHGNSAKVLPCTIEFCAKAVGKFLDEMLGNEKCVLVGHSLGAQTALKMISQNPSKVELAVLMSALVHPTPILYHILIKPFIGSTINMLNKDSMLNAQVKQFKFCDAEMEKHFKESIRSITEPVLSDIYRENQNFRIPENLSGLRIPVLALAGSREMGKMRKSTATIARAFGGKGKAFLIPKAAHTCPWTHYETTNKAIEAWIEGNSLPLVLRKVYEP